MAETVTLPDSNRVKSRFSEGLNLQMLTMVMKAKKAIQDQSQAMMLLESKQSKEFHESKESSSFFTTAAHKCRKKSSGRTK